MWIEFAQQLAGMLTLSSICSARSIRRCGTANGLRHRRFTGGRREPNMRGGPPLHRSTTHRVRVRDSRIASILEHGSLQLLTAFRNRETDSIYRTSLVIPGVAMRKDPRPSVVPLAHAAQAYQQVGEFVRRTELQVSQRQD